MSVTSPRWVLFALLVVFLFFDSVRCSSHRTVDVGAWTSFVGRRASSNLASLYIYKNPIGSTLHPDTASLTPHAWLELPPGAAYHFSVGYKATNRSDPTRAVAFRFNEDHGREVRVRLEPELRFGSGVLREVNSEAWLGGSGGEEEEVRVALELPDREDTLTGMVIAYKNQSLEQLVEEQRRRYPVRDEL